MIKNVWNPIGIKTTHLLNYLSRIGSYQIKIGDGLNSRVDSALYLYVATNQGEGTLQYLPRKSW